VDSVGKGGKPGLTGKSFAYRERQEK
jgi:hypothetical protein